MYFFKTCILFSIYESDFILTMHQWYHVYNFSFWFLEFYFYSTNFWAGSEDKISIQTNFWRVIL